MTLEDWLRRSTQDIPAPSLSPSATDRIEEAVRLRIRRRRATHVTLGIASIAGVAALGIVIGGPYTGDRGGETSRPTAPTAAAPWISTPGTRHDAADDHWRHWPDCTSSQLRYLAGRSGARNGNATQLVTITNNSSTDCRLSGPPGMTAVAATRHAAVDAGRFAGTLLPLAGQGAARMLISVPAACPPSGIENTAVTLNISRLGGPTMLTGVYIPLACGTPVVGLFEPDGDFPPSNDPLSHLEAMLEGPDTVSPGQEYEYVVTLLNPTSDDISLDECPSYTQTFEDLRSETLELNCAAITSIPAGMARTFAMKTTVPEAADPQLKFGWHLETESGASTGLLLSVR